MPEEYTLLLETPEPFETCPNCRGHQRASSRALHPASHPFSSGGMRGQVQRPKKALWSWPPYKHRDYCAIICDNCKDNVGWESPKVVHINDGTEDAACGFQVRDLRPDFDSIISHTTLDRLEGTASSETIDKTRICKPCADALSISLRRGNRLWGRNDRTVHFRHNNEAGSLTVLCGASDFPAGSVEFQDVHTSGPITARIYTVFNLNPNNSRHCHDCAALISPAPGDIISRDNIPPELVDALTGKSGKLIVGEPKPPSMWERLSEGEEYPMPGISTAQAILDLDALVKAGILRRFYRVTTEDGEATEYKTFAEIPDGTLPTMIDPGYYLNKSDP